ncbi:hypothetical protein MVG78_13765 [Roseomonas gilardii subsp. gilardii]|uniref:BRO-N domain-containing protein n=1 Tax=Roseomonas gilardii TaxID=257708 RepID=UPI001FF7FB34|nr:BRO family protein [Roseomonas gilardii]UPG71622.1 hypothetical protein MVG78_13765 [Roseomonas gilardii subsp. gilardii]
MNTFTFPITQQSIRVVEIEGQPWFVAADVCRILDLKMSASGTFVVHLRRLDVSEMRREMVPTIVSGRELRRQNMLISESGLYKLIMRSDKPEARRFQDWVTRDVLPAIRKDGSYVMGEEKVRTGEMSEDELILRAVQALQRKVDRLTEEKAEVERERDEMAPKAAFVDEHVEDVRMTLARFGRTLTGLRRLVAHTCQ